MRDDDDRPDDGFDDEPQEVEVERDHLETPLPVDHDEQEWDDAYDDPPIDLVPFGLTVRQWTFVNEYLVDFCAIKAAQRAGYSCKSQASGAQIMRRPRVREALRWMLNVRADLYEAQHSRILQELGAQAYSDLADFVDWDGRTFSVIPFHEIPKAKRGALRKIKFTERTTEHGTDRTIEVELKASQKPLELLMRATGMLRETEGEDSRGAFRKWFDAQMSGAIPPARRALPDSSSVKTEEEGEDET